MNSLNNYSTQELLDEVSRRTGSEDTRIYETSPRIPVNNSKDDIGLEDLSHDLAGRIMLSQSDIKQDRAINRYSFEVMDGFTIHVEYRNIMHDGMIEAELENINIEVNRRLCDPNSSSLSENFLSFFFCEDNLEEFFWEHLLDNLPPVFVSEEDVEQLVIDVGIELDIEEEEAYSIVHRLLGVY